MTLVLSGTSGVALDSIKNSLMFLETAKATTSGTSIDFTGIPSWAKKITVILNGVSANGTSQIQLQIGGGSVETTGYTGVVDSQSSAGGTTASITSGLALARSGGSSAAGFISGLAIFTLIGSNNWIATFLGSITGSITMITFASTQKTISNTLDRVRLTTVNGTDTFDAGSVNILIEGYV